LARGLLLLCFFHLICHALFKAALFITSGVIIHSLDRRQDFRNSVLFNQITPLLRASSIICILCLCGFPFLSGFFSKDFILDRFRFSFFFFFLFLISVLLTISYSLRFSFYLIIFLLTVRNKLFIIYDILYFILIPIWRLVIFAVFFGVF